MSIGPTQQRYWDWRALGNFALGGAGGGMIVASVLVFGVDTESALPVGLAAVLISLGLGCVFLKLGRPLRFLNVFRNPATSWMSREAYIATLLVPVAALSFFYPSNLLLAPAALLAGAFLYAQARILTACRGIPAWRVSQIVPLLVTTGLVEGAGMLLVLGSFAQGPIPHLFVGFVLLALAARALAWKAYQRALRQAAPTTTVRLLDAMSPAFLLGGHAAPAAAIAGAAAMTQGGPILAAVAGGVMTASGWLCKLQVVNRAALDQGYAIAHSPARGGDRAGPGTQPGWPGA